MKKKNLLMLGALFASVLIWAASPIPAMVAEVYEAYAVDDDRDEGEEPGSKEWIETILYNSGLEHGRMIWGDINNDGRMDMFVVASNNALLYLQNQDGSFDQVSNHGIQGLDNASAEFIDYNNDENLDLIVVGKQGEDPKVYVYRNTGAEGGYAFVLDEGVTSDLHGVQSDAGDRQARLLQAVDYNNDGWVDLVMYGGISDYNEDDDEWIWCYTALYKNNEGRFERQIDIVDGGDFVHMKGGSIHVADINKDGYADIIANGYDGDGWNAYIYVNNGDGTFTKTDFPEHIYWENSEMIFVDVNNDGYPDIVAFKDDVANLYLNNKDNTFTKLEDTGLRNSNLPSITAGDLNNDGYIDLFVTAMNDNGTIYYNNGDNTFTAVQAPDVVRVRSGNASIVDLNGDGNLDLAAFGYGTIWGVGYAIHDISESEVAQNQAPSSPGNLQVEYANGIYVMTWDKSTDNITPLDAIRYNVYAKNTQTGKIHMYAPADLSTGKLKVGGAIVPLITTSRFEFNLPEADYIFGVQAVDQADVASRFHIIPLQAKWDEDIVIDTDLERGRMIWGDINNDGHLDVFAIGSGKAVLYLQDKDGNFEEVENPGIAGLNWAFAEFIDYNNDGNLDLIIVGAVGEGGEYDRRVYVYKNTGADGNYAFELDEETSEDLFAIKSNGDRQDRLLQAVDYDNDGWVDLVVSGSIMYYDYMQKEDGEWDWGWNWRYTAVYKNVEGRFVRQTDIVDGGDFVQMEGGSLHAADINNDGYADIIIGGRTYGIDDRQAAYIYINNGDGTFTRTDFPETEGFDWNDSDVVFADMNSDGYADIVLFRSDKAELYLNNQNNTFTKVENTGLLPANLPNIAFGDINNDGHVDLFVIHMNDSNGTIYYNNGDNTFTAVQAPDKVRVRTGSADIVDINGDGNLDLTAIGYGAIWGGGYAINNIETSGISQNKAPQVPTNLNVVYEDGKFSLTWDKSTDDFTADDAIRYNVYAKDTESGMVYTYAPVNIETGKLKSGASVQTLITTNKFEMNLPDGKYTFGVQAIDQANLGSQFVIADYPIVRVEWEEHEFNSGTGENGRMIWGDVNNDGRMDMFVVGTDGTKLFIQGEDGQLNVAEGNNFTTLYRGSAEFIDYDNDGNLDVVIVGKLTDDASAGQVFVYRNTGEAGGYTFELDQEVSSDLFPTESSDPNHRGRMIQAFDYDNDGWMDLIFIGRNRIEDNPRLTTLYRNVGGRFERIRDAVDGEDFIQMARGSVHVADMNNDGYADIVTCGFHDIPTEGNDAYIYINNGDGTFTRTDFPETGIFWEQCEIIFTDINNDGYADLVAFNQDMGSLYINNKNNTFTKVEDAGLLASQRASISAGDIDNDGYVDLFVSGLNDNIGTIYYNNGDNTFTAVVAPEQVRARSGSVNIIDIDGDGYLDLSNFGYGNDWASGYALNKGERTGIPQNAAPTVPTGLSVANVQEGEPVVITWNASTDVITPQAALRYNVYIQEEGSDKIYAYAPVNIETGKLKIGGAIVPLLTTTQVEFVLPKGKYTIGVQAVDQSDMASKFAITTVTVEPGEGIEAPSASDDVVVIAANQQVEIRNNVASNVDYTIASVSGQVVKIGTCAANAIETVALNDGMYVVRLSYEGTVRTVKVLVH